MPQEFQLGERICGIAMGAAAADENVQVLTRELVGPMDAHLVSRLEELHLAVLSKIPNLPLPSTIDHVLAVIRPDLTGTAYVNELQIQAMVRVNRDVAAGSPVYRQDITEVASVDLGVQ